MSNQRDDYLLKCPFCNRKMWLSAAEAHRNARHPRLSEEELERAIMEGLKQGSIAVRHYAEPDPNFVSATHRMLRHKRTSKLGVTRFVSGGKTQ